MSPCYPLRMTTPQGGSFEQRVERAIERIADGLGVPYSRRTQVSLDGPVPFVWSGYEKPDGGIVADWYDCDAALKVEAFAHSSGSLV